MTKIKDEKAKSKIQVRREELGMTMVELAHKAGWSYTGIYNVERMGQIPRADRANKIADALKTTSKKLWGTTAKEKS